jgi:hypothetical protein
MRDARLLIAIMWWLFKIGGFLVSWLHMIHDVFLYELEW